MSAPHVVNLYCDLKQHQGRCEFLRLLIEGKMGAGFGEHEARVTVKSESNSGRAKEAVRPEPLSSTSSSRREAEPLRSGGTDELMTALMT